MLSRHSFNLWVLVATTSFTISCGTGNGDSSGDTTSSGSVSASSTGSSGQGATTSTGGNGGAATSSGAGAGSSSTGGGGTGSSSTGGGGTGSSSTGGGGTGSSSTGGGGTGSSSTGGGGTGGGGPGSDEFEGNVLDPSWLIVNGNNFKYSVSNGALHITPTTNTLWWEDSASGVLVHKLMSGNFKVTTAVRARRASDPTQPVGPTDYQFGGIMVRDPKSTTNQNYVFGVVGDRGEALQIETKSTTNNASKINAENWPSGDAQLRLCRVGTMIHVLSRPIGGGSWAIAAPWGPPYERPDLPNQLQVGLIAYTWTNSPDLRASFEYVHYAPVASEADCTAD